MDLNFSLANILEEAHVYSDLKNKVWVVINWIDQEKTSIIFKTRKEVLIVKKGQVEKFRWEFAGKNIIVINRREGNFLFKIELLDESVCVLKIDEDRPYTFFVIESLYEQGIKSADSVFHHIENKYNVKSNALKFKVDPIKGIISEEYLNKLQRRTKYRNHDLITLYISVGVAVIVLILIVVNNT